MEWIKTVDRLPDDGNKVWGFDGYDIEVYVFDMRWCGRIVWREANVPMEYTSVIEFDGMTHWMPYYTPDPPTD